jgi:hypothetical protein
MASQQKCWVGKNTSNVASRKTNKAEAKNAPKPAKQMPVEWGADSITGQAQLAAPAPWYWATAS